jgi:hypothetical protein
MSGHEADAAFRGDPSAARVRRAILWGTLAVGTLDALDAIVFFGLRGATPLRIFQSIASGLLGRAAYQGGLGTALLGVVLHYFIAFLIVSTAAIAARWVPGLADRPWAWGPVYGLIAYAVMNMVVLPLSSAAVGSPSASVVVNGLFIHALGVGVPSALTARAMRDDR